MAPAPRTGALVAAALGAVAACGVDRPADDPALGPDTTTGTGVVFGSDSSGPRRTPEDPTPPSRVPGTDSGEGDSSTGVPPDVGGPALGMPPGPPFESVAEATGVLIPHTKAVGQWGMGIAWRDWDADGDEDLFVTGGSLPSRLLDNVGDGTFVAVDDPAIAALVDTAGATWADVDDDGWPELLVVGRDRGWLLGNDAGALVDVTPASGLELQARPFGQASAWADVDGDGHLDVFIAHSGYQGSRLYLGNGDRTFVDASASFAITVAYYPLAVGFVDFDHDGDPDLYVVHDRRDGNHLWRNDGPGCGGWCMTEIATQVGADVQVEGMGLAVGDPDEDGDFDLFFTDSLRATLLRNDDGVAFTDVTVQAGLDAPAFGWGALFFDYDGDGRLDLYEGLQSPRPGTNRLYRGWGDGTFDDRSSTSGVQCPGESMSVAFADYDGDGAPDVVVGNENEDYRLYRNRRGDVGQKWLTLQLWGAGPVARDAVGTRVVVETSSGRRMLRQVEIGSGFGSSNTPRLHFGVSGDPAVSVEVTWPDGLVTYPWPPPDAGVWTIEHPG